MDADRGSPPIVIRKVCGATPRAVASSSTSAIASASVRGPGVGVGVRVRVEAEGRVAIGGGALVVGGEGAWQAVPSQPRRQRTTPTAAVCFINPYLFRIVSLALQLDSKLATPNSKRELPHDRSHIDDQG